MAGGGGVGIQTGYGVSTGGTTDDGVSVVCSVCAHYHYHWRTDYHARRLCHCHYHYDYNRSQSLQAHTRHGTNHFTRQLFRQMFEKRGLANDGGGIRRDEFQRAGFQSCGTKVIGQP